VQHALVADELVGAVNPVSPNSPSANTPKLSLFITLLPFMISLEVLRCL
jgi:hypothetical protein